MQPTANPAMGTVASHLETSSDFARRANHRVFRFCAIAIVQPLREKYSYFFFSEFVISSRPFRSDTRGVRVVTNVERNAVDVNVPIDVRHIRGRRSRVVLARPCRR